MMILYLLAAVGSFSLLVFAVSQISLYTSLFDYRFGFITLSVCILGLTAGLAVSHWLATKLAGKDGATWIAASGLGLAISIGAPLIVPFGTVASFLFLIAISAMPVAFGAMGVTVLCRKHNASIQRIVWATVIGAIAGVFVSPWLLDMMGGPLQMSGLVAVALTVLAMTAHGRRFTVALSVASFAVLGLAGIYSKWDFSSLPRWVHEDGPLAKPLYMESTSDSVKHLSARWDAFSRIDVVAHKNAGDNLLWVYANGMFSGLMPAGRSGEENSEWFKKNFPLITLSLQAGQPQKILIINPGAGLEARMAADAGVSRINGLESNSAMGPILERWRDYHGSLSTRPGVKLAYGDVRHTLHHDSERYDQIYLPIAPIQVPGWTERGLTDAYLYTKEAFRDYWLHLRSGGMLVVLAGEERLYMRSLLMAWEAMQDNPTGEDGSLVRHSWGFRMANKEPLPRLYEYLLILVKGPVTEDMAARIQELSRDKPIVGLFGPNVTVGRVFDVRYQPYNMLYHPRGLDLARTALRDAMSWHLRAPADLASATDQRPFFFQIVRDIHPFLKWLLTACLVLLIYIFLFPLAAERKLDHPASGECPPLPVFLGYFLFLGMGTMLTMVALMHQTAPFSGYSDYALPAVVGALLPGAIAGAAVYRRSIGYFVGYLQHGAAIASAALCGLLYWMLGSFLETTSGCPALLRVIVVMGFAFSGGLLSAVLLMSGISHLSRNLIALLPWSWVTFGLAAVVGADLAFWFAQYWGWGTVWITAAGCYSAILGLSLWMRYANFYLHPRVAITIQR